MRLSEILKSYRWAERMTLRELAAEIGVSHSTLNRFEDGRGELSGECLGKVIQWMLSDSARCAKAAKEASRG